MLDVSQSFASTEILITGANGFVGKVALALLLDRYPQTPRVHVLVRPRRGQSGSERFEQEVLDSPALEPLIEKLGREAVTEKIRVYEGDAATLDDRAVEAWRGVGLILHCAGLVEFFPPVEQALAANVDALERIAETARRLNAKLVHVSTCYVAGRADGLIEEDEPIEGFYPLRRDREDRVFDYAQEIAWLRGRLAANDGVDDSSAAREQRIELGRARAERWGWVNTYTYSKSLGEQLLAAQQGLEWSIVRPAIVESALEYPFPGWVEGGRTAAPLVLMALGGMTDWPARPDLALEVVPVDQVAAAMLAVGALLLDGQAEPVYHLAAADVNPFAMLPLIELLGAEASKRGASVNGGPRLFTAEQFMRRSRNQRRRAERLEGRLSGLSRWLAAKGLPGGNLAAAKAAQLRRLALQGRFRQQTIEQYLPFTAGNRYVFEAGNIREAVTKLSAEDRKRLPWTPEQIDWPSYWRDNQIEGILKWVQPDAVKGWEFQI